MIFGQPYTLLCKRTFSIGEDNGMKSPFDGSWIGERKKTYLIKDKWYEVTWTVTDFMGPVKDFFHVINEEGNREAHSVIDDPESPRSYAKWFYTPAEWREMQINSILDDEVIMC